MTTKIKTKTTNLNITDRAIVLAVDFHKLGNHRKLKNHQYDVDADRKMITASKRLLDSAELKKLSRFDSKIRDYVSARALPSMFKGFWLVPYDLLEQVDSQLEQFAKERRDIVEEFLTAYPKLIEKSAELLRTTFNPNDYPTVEQVRSTFGLYWRYVSFGVPEQLEQIKADVFKREQEKAAKHWEAATEEMRNLLRANMSEMVDHMIDRLEPGEDGKVKVFRASMMDGVHDFISTFEARNITDDSQLKTLVSKARDLVDGVAHENLKTDAELRAKIKAGMAKIKKQLDPLVVVRPTRKLRFGEEDNE
jgi:hypothetical protein